MDDVNSRELPQVWRSGDWKTLADSLGGAGLRLRLASGSLLDGVPAGSPVGKVALFDEHDVIVGYLAVYPA